MAAEQCEEPVQNVEAPTLTSPVEMSDAIDSIKPQSAAHSNLESRLVCTSIAQIDLIPLSPPPPHPIEDAILIEEFPQQIVEIPVVRMVKNIPTSAMITGAGHLSNLTAATTTNSNAAESQPIDYASLVKPLEDITCDGVGDNSGVRQILACLAADSPNAELLSALVNECDLVYECRMCRSLHRALPNFLAHKRFYCRDLYADRGKRAIDAASETRLNQSNWAAFLRSSHHYGQSRAAAVARGNKETPTSSPPPRGSNNDDDQQGREAAKHKAEKMSGSKGAAIFKTRSFWKRLGQGTSVTVDNEERSTKVSIGKGFTQTTSSTPSIDEAMISNDHSRPEIGSDSVKLGRNKRKTSLPQNIKTKDSSASVHVVDSQNQKVKSSTQYVPVNELPRLKIIPQLVTPSGIKSPIEVDKTLKTEYKSTSTKSCSPVTISGESNTLCMSIPAVELNPTLKCLDCSDSVTYDCNRDFIEHLSSEHSPQGFNIRCPLCPHFMFNLASLVGHIGMFHRKEGLVNVFKALTERSVKGTLALRPKSVQGLAREKYANLGRTRAFITNQLQADIKVEAQLEASSSSKLIGDVPLRRGKRGRPMLPKNSNWTSKFTPFNRYSKGSRYSQTENYHTGPVYICQGCGKRFKNLKIKMRHAVFCPSSQQPTPNPLSPGEVASTAIASNSMTRCNSTRFSQMNIAPYTNIQKAKVLDLFSDPRFCQKSAADLFNPANLHLIDAYYNSDTLECKICDRRFNNHYTMSRHMFRHFDIYRFKCQVCHLGSYDKCEIYSHITDLHVPNPLTKRECRRAIIDIRNLPLSEQRCSNAVIAGASVSSSDLPKSKDLDDGKGQESIAPTNPRNKKIHPNPYLNYSKRTSSDSEQNHARKRRYDLINEDMPSLGNEILNSKNSMPLKNKLNNPDQINVLTDSPCSSGQATPINGSDERLTVGHPPVKVKRRAGRPRKNTKNSNVTELNEHSKSSTIKPNPITSTIIKTYNEETGSLTSSFQRLQQELGAANDALPTTVLHGANKSTSEISYNPSAPQNNSLGAAARKKFETALAKATAPLSKSSSTISPRRRGINAQSNITTTSSRNIERTPFVPVGDVKLRCSEAQSPRFTTIRILSGGKAMSPPYSLSLGVNQSPTCNNSSPILVPRLLFKSATNVEKLDTNQANEHVTSPVTKQVNNEDPHTKSPLKQRILPTSSPPRSSNNLVIPQTLYLRATSNEIHPNGDVQKANLQSQ